MIGRIPIKQIPWFYWWTWNNKVFSINGLIYPRSYVTRSHGTWPHCTLLHPLVLCTCSFSEHWAWSCSLVWLLISDFPSSAMKGLQNRSDGRVLVEIIYTEIATRGQRWCMNEWHTLDHPYLNLKANFIQKPFDKGLRVGRGGWKNWKIPWWGHL